jgi:hypothetical protein
LSAEFTLALHIECSGAVSSKPGTYTRQLTEEWNSPAPLRPHGQPTNTIRHATCTTTPNLTPRTVRHEGVLPEILQMLLQLRSFTLIHRITTSLLHFVVGRFYGRFAIIYSSHLALHIRTGTGAGSDRLDRQGFGVVESFH